MVEHEFKKQKWLWDHRGINVFEVKNGKHDQVSWSEVLGIHKYSLRLCGGKRIVFQGGHDEVLVLKKQLRAEWKVRNPCAWVRAQLASVRAVRWMFLFFYPSVIAVITIIPWVAIFGYMRYHGIYNAEILDQGVRLIVLGVIMIASSIGCYVFYIKRQMKCQLREVAFIALDNNCQVKPRQAPSS